MAATLNIPNSAEVAGVASIVLIVPDAARRATLTRMLADLTFPVLRTCTTYPDSRYLDELTALDSDVFVVDLDSNVEQALAVIENICGRDPAATVMATSSGRDAGLLIRSMRVSTVATNFAIALTKQDAGKVVIVDMDLQLGEVALGLSLTPPFSLLDALKNEDRLDSDFLGSLLVRHTSGLTVLAAPEQYTSFDPLPSGVKKLFAILRRQFAFVVVDAGAARGDAEETLFDLADTVYLVTEVSIPALRNARRLLSYMAARERNPHVEVVLNRFNIRDVQIDENSTTKVLGRPVDWKIPNDFVSVRTAENTGVPLAMKDSPISRIVNKMATNASGKPVQGKKSRNLLGMFR